MSKEASAIMERRNAMLKNLSLVEGIWLVLVISAIPEAEAVESQVYKQSGHISEALCQKLKRDGYTAQ